MEYWRNWRKKRTGITRIKSFPVGVDVMSHCFFSVDFWDSYSSCCCIIVANSPSLIIIFSFFYIFCTFSSSSCCSSKASWGYLEIVGLSSGGIDMAIAAYHSWGDLIYYFFGTDLLQSIFDRQFRRVVLLVLQQCGNDCIVIGGRLAPFEISGCAIDRVYDAQCKCKRKRWFVFYDFLGTCWETDYFRLSCELVGWLNIAKYQELKIVYCAHAGAIEGVVGEGGSVSWGGARTKGEVHKRKITKKVLAQWFVDINEFFPDTIDGNYLFSITIK